MLVQTISSAKASKGNETEDMKVSRDEHLSVMLVFGSEDSGPLESGTYTFSANVNIRSLYDEEVSVPKLSFANKVMAFVEVSVQAVKEAKMDIFGATNWLAIYAFAIILV